MQRNSDGGHRFSFTRFITNAIPNIASAPIDHDLVPQEQDALFEHQLGESDPLRLCDSAFLAGGVTKSKSLSSQIHRALLKNGVLIDERTDAETPRYVDTSKITSKFAHELAMITSHAQKKVVNLLFFWEEEIARWRVLIGEQAELRTVIQAERETGGNVGTYEKRLKELDGLLRLKPTLRGSDAQKKDALPDYEDAGKRK